MNYLLHYIIDHKKNYKHFNVGLILPDIFKGALANFKNLNAHNNIVQEISEGCYRHLLSDKAFHTSNFFEEHTHIFNQAFINKKFTNAFQRKWFIAHICFELMLDRAMVKTFPELTNNFYDELNAVDENELRAFLEINNGNQIDTYISRINHFREVQYIRYYTDNNKFIFSLNKIMARVGLPELSQIDAFELENILTELEFTYFADGEELLKSIKKIF